MFCPKCGNSVGDEFNFCFNCGFNLSTLKETNSTNVPSVPTITASNETTPQIPSTQSSVRTFPEFKGTQESYEALLYKFLYIDKDIEKARDFEDFVNDNYPHSKFEARFSTTTAIWLLNYGYLTNNLGILETLVHDFDTQELSDIGIAKAIGTLTSSCFWYNIIGQKDYNLSCFCYEWHKVISEYNELYEENARNSNSYTQDKMNNLAAKFNGDLSSVNFKKIYIEKFDLKHILPHISKYASQNSTIITDTYTRVLDNAIKYHGAPYLNNMYPTAEQRSKCASVIENELLNQFRKATTNLHIALQKGDDCLRLINNIKELDDKSSGSSLLKKGALTLGLGLVSGPLGLINAAREGYNLYEASEKSDKLKETLDSEFDSFVDEAYSCLDDFFECLDALSNNLEENIMEKYLQQAIDQIFTNLKNNNVTIRPLRDYLL